MTRVQFFCAAALTALTGLALAAPASADERSELRIALQASMQRHIDRNVIDDAYLTLDLEDGSLERYIPMKAHTAILIGDGYYVLCAEMRDETGKSIPVDYYLAKAGRGFRVFRTEIANRSPLRSLMKSGKVRKF